MSLQAVEAAVKARSEAEAAVRRECAAAHAAGIPIAKIARAAGVTRATVYAWLEPTD